MSIGEIEYRYQHVFDGSGIATAFVAPGEGPGEGRFIHVNAAMCALLGYTEDELCAMTVNDVTHPDDRTPNTELRVDMTEGLLNNFQLEKRFVHKSGRVVWINLSVTAVRDDQGRYLYDIGQHQDITELKLAEQHLRESEQRFRHFAESSSDWFWETDANHRFSFVSDRISEIIGFAAEDFPGRKRIELLRVADDPRVWAEHERTLCEHRPFRDFTYRRRAADGRIRHLSISGKPVFDDNGAFIGYRGTGTDVTAIVEAQAKIAETQLHLTRAMDLSPAVFALFDADDRLVFCNTRYRDMYETPLVSITPGVTFGEIVSAFADQFGIGESEEETLAWVAQRLARRDQPARSYSYQRSDGEWVEVSDYVLEDQSIFTIGQIITERRRIEAELHQAQKMEAIGQLTGGVAHDFNNLLAVILGNAELLGDTLGEDPYLAGILQAATRGADLIQRMLAFSRRQALAPRAIDPRELIADLLPLFERTLGQQIKIATDVPDDAWPVRADPGQLENALLNLAINARDAMPKGGTLEIRCANIVLDDRDVRVGDEIKAGDYLRIAVRDTGTGMPAEVIAHAFDPFFTTKDVGKGTGLGLSMVYGFARQSGGDVVIDSTLGQGTELSLYLPRAQGPTATYQPAGKEAVDLGDSEIILVVEDDGELRAYIIATLERLGYRVIGVGDAAAALRTLAEGAQTIGLLLCDVVLPGGTSGPDLADMVRDLYPELKLIFMSGYAPQLYGSMHVPGFDNKLLTKPFKREELADAVRDALVR